MNKQKLSAYPCSIRIHNADTLSLINELAEKSGNRNEVLNAALELGVPALYERVLGKEMNQKKESSQHVHDVGRKLKEIRNGSNELFVELSVIEAMVAGLFNVKALELEGEEVTARALLDGSLCDLSEFIAGMKSDLIKAIREESDGQ